jgi:hypothetical protein
MKIKFAISCAMIALFLLSPLICAGLGVSGAIIEKDVKPGETFVHDMTVCSDHSGPPMDIAVDVMGLNQSLEGDNMELDENEDIGPYSACAFMKVNPSKFHLEPGEIQSVIVEGKIPEDAKPGGRYAMINIHSLPVGNGTVGIVVAIEVPVRLVISGPGLIKTGSIEELKLERPISAKQQDVSVTFKNKGNSHFKARADATLKDREGSIIAGASTPLSSNIIPGASRLFRLAVAPGKDLEPGIYFMNSTVKLDNGTVLASKETQFQIQG